MPAATSSRAVPGADAGVTVRLRSLRASGGDAEGDTFPYTVDVAYRDADGLERVETLPDVESLIGSNHNGILASDHCDNRIDGPVMTPCTAGKARTPSLAVPETTGWLG